MSDYTQMTYRQLQDYLLFKNPGDKAALQHYLSLPKPTARPPEVTELDLAIKANMDSLKETALRLEALRKRLENT
ncbi:MAG: hypothetical protein HC903_19060 [Methylacidiphilales bacterium]|nr:hypothetical protein [Candidatus Methylacidiphilales bacterium]NJR17119.1 hypothetical protein [Calothrix sp. CSU_2_0]